jgi:hypothetical protein
MGMPVENVRWINRLGRIFRHAERSGLARILPSVTNLQHPLGRALRNARQPHSFCIISLALV